MKQVLAVGLTESDRIARQGKMPTKSVDGVIFIDNHHLSPMKHSTHQEHRLIEMGERVIDLVKDGI